MAIFGLFKQLLLGQHPSSNSQSGAARLPAVVQCDVNPMDSQWRTMGEIGEGAFGKIEKVCSVESPHLIAASKTISLQEGEELDDFLIEIEILTLCKGHGNIVDLIACYFHEQKLYMMLEYCAGGAVDNIMVELNKPLNEPQIAHVTREVCRAVDFLHARGIIHRDIKAGNVLLTADAAVKLADFGVSAIIKNNQRRDSFIGTPYWMAPEVIICETFKDQPYDCRADIWSLGITCIEMAQVEPPNHNMNPMRVVIKVQKSEPPTLAQPHRWTPEFSDFLRRCLVKNVDGRWSAAQLLSHPFICSADDRRPIVRLLCEKNAEVVDEEVMEAESGTTTDVDEDDSVKIVINNTDDHGHEHEHDDTFRPQEEAIQILDELDMALDEDGIAQRECCSATSGSQLSSTASGGSSSNKNNIGNGTIISCSGGDGTTANSVGAEHAASAREPSAAPMGIASTSAPSTNVTAKRNNIPFSTKQFEAPQPPTAIQFEQQSPIPHEEAIQIHIPDELYMTLEEDGIAQRECCSATSGSQPSSTATTSGSSRTSNNIGTNNNNRGNAISVSTTTVSFQQSTVSVLDTTFNDPHKRQNNNTISVNIDTPRRHTVTGVNTSPTAPIQITPRQNTVPENTDLHRQSIVSNDSVSSLPPLKQIAAEYAASAREPSAALMGIASTSAPSTNALNNSANSSHEHQLPEPLDLPPPEPPVDYDFDSTPRAIAAQQQQYQPPAGVQAGRQPYHQQQKQVKQQQKRPHPPSAVEDVQPAPAQLRKSPHRATVTKRTRTYVIDGVEVTSTSLHVLSAQQDFELRKRELRDLKRMQREEARQQQELNSRSEQVREHQERRFVFEKQSVQRTYEAEIELVSRTQKKKMEETERQQEEELRTLAKSVRVEQERDLRVFRDRLRQEQKIMKQEVEMLPKAQRKNVSRQRKEQLERHQCERESDYVEQQMRTSEAVLLRARDRHREKLCLQEKKCLEQKHQLERNMETALWELEEAQLAEKHALLTQQFRDVFHLQRTHMLARHAKEQQHVLRINQSQEEQLLRALNADRKALPKMLRSEAKTRTLMFRKSLEVDLPGESDTWTAKVRAFEEREKQRTRQKTEEYDLKCKRRLAQLVERNKEVLRELEEIHNEKRNMLLENERAKLGEYEREYQQLLADWKASLPARKSTLEAKFSDELATQERFYGTDGTAMSSSTSTSSSSAGGGPTAPFSFSGSSQKHF
uniref:Protein kinase domain-containing protein n=1 Tax=Globodera rostochiensis TaxID=31243 RepID=A0A914GYF4_GLORO